MSWSSTPKVILLTTSYPAKQEMPKYLHQPRAIVFTGNKTRYATEMRPK